MTIKEYAKKILADSGCDKYTYGGEMSSHILDDLKTAFPNGMEYSYIDVANAILAMSRPKPIYKAPFVINWYTDDADGQVEVKTFDEAMRYGETILAEWIVDQINSYPMYPEDWSQDQMENWDYMIYNCGFDIKKYNPNKDEYEVFWEPSDEFYSDNSWMLYNDLVKMAKRV